MAGKVKVSLSIEEIKSPSNDIAQDTKKIAVRKSASAFEDDSLPERHDAAHSFHSVRNACMGSMCVARRAGNQVAMSAAAASNNGATVNAMGSSAPT